MGDFPGLTLQQSTRKDHKDVSALLSFPKPIRPEMEFP